jgi:Bacterial regulatory helix-turn-helix protein, lysR family
MLSEPVTVETSETEFSRRLGSAVQLRALEKSETKKVPKLYQGGSLQLGMIDLNLFRLFDAMMLHRSVRKASQMLSVTPSAVSHALSRLRQSIGDELFVFYRVRHGTNAARA